MRVGIIPNINKENVIEVITLLISKLQESKINYVLSSHLLEKKDDFNKIISNSDFAGDEEICNMSDIVVSIGGDGTMLNTAYDARNGNPLLAGLNFGKLGFLAEFEVGHIEEFVMDIKNKNFIIEERMTLGAVCSEAPGKALYCINDLVIDKGGWPKMIEMTIKVDDDYVSTFSADGIIIATPTGSTGYSLSTGGPIVSPKADAITLSPISPHTLTMRPLVLSSIQRIIIDVNSPHSSVQVNSDGQRVHYFKPPMRIEIFKSDKPIRLIHTRKTNYFEILRKKLFWGLDVRNNSLKEKGGN
ncbi:MAG: NAD(+)/NADH kinase [Melioribacteraceae bacterium]|nr:NAD(+)/NADH kinase [Melioribacteraceae bacterium]MCF8353491.1 NAD(+)/NADH kinase [Melioribacteraceae bacterium]MCF8392620.1 NAD(+)/NADH kinase [Melioribacteraceae bacterium]MCF8418508.1 NAD(+)/NADH kinase [Melioribacteraceae bacterium]